MCDCKNTNKTYKMKNSSKNKSNKSNKSDKSDKLSKNNCQQTFYSPNPFLANSCPTSFVDLIVAPGNVEREGCLQD